MAEQPVKVLFGKPSVTSLLMSSMILQGSQKVKIAEIHDVTMAS